ncbi:YhgE/Pip domain-containing protein [Microbacterium sp. ARD32]|uniref:YhgE/Pip domain-containing protein n=1 Tax=Microbacterium sp. ARD32 TaxID=2962577 RepID=UPI0028820C1E|nr:YhgE/Pip domain-containing protein [Microbacterium sp. ARD32]MDT0156285.1 YhgE/Pip domain-containing protein [Microbacterium sp. ARD32]
MTLPIERARSRRPITWLTLIGVLLLPAIIGGILVTALQNPTDRLESMTAAVVNLDKPVTIDDQYTPLGRQLASGLVEGSDDIDSNLTWVISNEDDAAKGLGDGTYQAVVTIPESFSADATSSGVALKDGGDAAEQAKITVTTPPDGRVADDLITNQIATVAASTMGTMLSEATVGNVLVGFTTIGDQLGDAADGASKLADGARSAADGAAALPDGASKLADGANGLADGASKLSGGAAQLSDGATKLGSGLDTIASKTREAGAGATQLGQGLTSGAATLEKDGLVPELLFTGANGAAQATAGVADGVAGVKSGVDGLVQACGTRVPGVDPLLEQVCAGLTQLQSGLPQLSDGASQAKAASAGVAAGLAAFDEQAPAELAKQMRTAGSAASQLGSGLGQLASGVDQSAAGARSLAGGASDLGDGASALASGATQLGDGASALSEGAGKLADGVDSLASGTGDLADGLKTASTSLPSFDEQQSTKLASVIADPVKASAEGDALFGPTAIPLLSAVVLWFGALASFIALRAVPGNALTSRRSSIGMVLRGFWPAAALGAGQGLLVALIVQIVAGYDAATWWGFAAFAMLAGVAFAAVNQALVAVLGGIGRWVSALVGVIAVATGLISTIPGWLAGLGAAMPTAPALGGLIVPNGAAAAGLIVWAVLSLGAATLAVTARRTTSAKAVLAAA